MNEDIGIINTWMRMYQDKCKCAETIEGWRYIPFSVLYTMKHAAVTLTDLHPLCFVPVGLLQLSEGLRVWDLSAGQSHSLLLADGDCVQPVLLYCGQQQEPMTVQSERSHRGQRSHHRSPNRAESYTVRPTLLPFCMEVCMSKTVWLTVRGFPSTGGRWWVERFSDCTTGVRLFLDFAHSVIKVEKARLPFSNLLDVHLTREKEKAEKQNTVMKANFKHLFILCVGVCRWVTLAVCAAVVRAVRCWQTITSWVSSRQFMSWPPERDSSTAGWAASGSSSSRRYVTEVRGSLDRLLLCWPLLKYVTPSWLVFLNMLRLYEMVADAKNFVQNPTNYLWITTCMI